MSKTVLINNIKKRILQGRDLTLDEALSLIEIKDFDDLEALFTAANEIREHFRGNKVDLCSITNAKSGDCPEDCAFCAQSAHNETKTEVYPLISVDEILKRVKNAYNLGAHRFCIVTSGCSVNEREFNDICKAIKLIKNNFPRLKIDASLGKLTQNQAKALKEAGLDRFNHNIETSKDFFSKICTTHSFKDRLETIRILKKVGIEVCCGGIIGLGENNRQRIEFAFYLKQLDVDCIPLNFLNPIEGTPFQDNYVPEPLELLKIISIFRLIHPKKQIRICGGRERNLGKYQSQIFRAGADAIIYGGYLTTKGNEPKQDLQMISDLGLSVE